jgi:hypothetical protein
MTRRVPHHDRGVSFVALDPADAHSAAALIQCADPHWVPRTMLGRMLERRKSPAGVAGERAAVVRAEYLRALLSVPQVIVGRAALLGNPALSRDLLDTGGGREALGRLLESGALVTLLERESSPVDELAEPVEERVFTSWTSLCAQVTACCLRRPSPSGWSCAA